jgi:hypothetical protein
MEPKPTGPRPTSRAPRATLVDFLSSRQLKAVIETRETRSEIQSRLRIAEAQAAHERRKDFLILVATLVGLAMVAVACLVVAFLPGQSEDKKWAMSVLASIVSGGLGYLTGKTAR